MSTVAEKIKKLINENDVKKILLAEAVGFSRHGFDYALAKNTFQFDTVVIISNFFKVPISYFLPDDNKNHTKKNYHIGDNSQVITGYVSESEVAYNTQNNEVEILREKIKNLEEISQVYKETMNFLKSENQRLQKELIRKQ